MLGASNPDSDYKSAIPCSSPGYSEPLIYNYLDPSDVYTAYKPISYQLDPGYYTTYQDSGTQSNPATDVVQASPYMPQMWQFLSAYDNPVNTRYVALPQTYYSALTYGSAPFEGTFSSPIYY